MKMLSSVTSVAGLLVMIASAPGHAAPPIKPPPFAAQIHTVTEGNVCISDGSSTVLNNTLANGNPNAVIVATHNNSAYTGGPAFVSEFGILTVYYDQAGTCGTAGRWVVNNDNSALSDLTVGQRINVIVTTP